MKTFLLAAIIVFVIVLFYTLRPTVIESYNAGSSYNNKHLLQMLKDIERKPLGKPTVEYIMTPAIYADISVEPQIPTNRPYIETIHRATRTNNINNINNNRQVNNIETILDRAERFIPYDIDEQRMILNDIRHNVHKNKLQELIEVENTTKPKIQEKYFTEVIIKSDPQNVHETTVNTNMKKKYLIIKSKNIPTDVIDIKTWLNTSKYSTSDRDKISKVLRMNSIWNDEKENEVYKTIWRYIKSQENQDLIDAFFGAILDCYENNSMVCTVGRINRIIGSLIMLDKDEEISRPVVTIDMLRKTILAKSYEILQSELKERGDEFTEAYNKDEVTPDFKEAVLKKVKEYLFAEYKDIFPEKTLDDLLTEVSYGI